MGSSKGFNLGRDFCGGIEEEKCSVYFSVLSIAFASFPCLVFCDIAIFIERLRFIAK
jgi:hypothetical protein